jgi:L-ascorbate metabolism protein UlaG (beta-lactamase superfamily)
MTTTFTYYGISFFQIEAQGRKLLVDPCITHNRLCPIKVEDIKGADIILVTHGAQDHMGNAIEIQKRTNAILISDPAVITHAISNGVKAEKTIRLLWGDLIEVEGVRVIGVECRHISFFKSKGGYLSGMPLSFVIYPEEGTGIYNVGDSALFSDMKLIGELYRPNVALIPIGGKPELTGGWSHMRPREAALCANWIRPEVIIPVHYDPASDESSQFKNEISKLHIDARVIALKPGETFSCTPHK